MAGMTSIDVCRLSGDSKRAGDLQPRRKLSALTWSRSQLAAGLHLPIGPGDLLERCVAAETVMSLKLHGLHELVATLPADAVDSKRLAEASEGPRSPFGSFFGHGSV